MYHICLSLFALICKTAFVGKDDDMAEKTPVTKNLEENIAQMEKLFENCDDIKKSGSVLGRRETFHVI